MKKARIAVVLLLGILLVSGLACEGDVDMLACVPSICLVCGTYVQQVDSNNYIELRSDRISYLYEGGTGTQGTWSYNGVELIMNWEGHPVATRAEIKGSRIIDDDGVVWVKQ